jgi:hypothetical protein
MAPIQNPHNKAEYSPASTANSPIYTMVTRPEFIRIGEGFIGELGKLSQERLDGCGQQTRGSTTMNDMHATSVRSPQVESLQNKARTEVLALENHHR